MRLYVCGPMSGLPEFNYPAFHEAEESLVKVGYEVSNPAKIDDVHKRDTDCAICGDGEAHDWSWYMRRAVTMLAEADGAAILAGWQRSRGARVEVDLAKTFIMPIASVTTWVERHKRLQKAFDEGHLGGRVIT